MQKLLHLRKEGPMHPQEDCKLVIRAQGRWLLLMVAVNSWLLARTDWKFRKHNSYCAWISRGPALTF